MTGKGPGKLTVAQVEEAATIAAIREAAPSEINGDDAAVLTPAPPNSRHVATTDALVEGRHFRFDWSTPFEVGAKAVTQNFADIQAMGARPSSVLMSLALPGDCELDVVREIARGVGVAAAPWAAELVGGDVVSSEQLVISVTAIGVLAGPDPVLAIDAAEAGQEVIASGVIGHSAAGEAVLRYFGSRDAVPNDAILQDLVHRHCAPELVVGRGTVARAAGVSSMTDNSDGLLRDLTTLADRSGVAIDLDGAALTPDAQLYHAAEILDADPWQWVLTGGEDHTLLGATGQQIPAGYISIGVVRTRTPDTGSASSPVVTVDGHPPVYTGGWDSLTAGEDAP